jgi:hypothetical protein
MKQKKYARIFKARATARVRNQLALPGLMLTALSPRLISPTFPNPAMC